MIKTSIEKLRQSIATLCWKIILWTSSKIPTDSSTLPDLCATDNATDAEQYIDRLNELLVNRSKTVREIAITAPYAGGKSTILKTYMRKFPLHIYTCISLSDFNETVQKEETDTNINKIEKSIVQQILYRTSSETTPNSRFRRIFPKPFSYFEAITQSGALLIWIALASIPFTSHNWIPYTFDSISHAINIFNKELWFASYLTALPLLILKDLIIKIRPITLTKMNVFQAELAFDKTKNDSVFNTYLEEIIYYFSVTKSDVVVFEDLDRLEESKIFVKLKELNKLINNSKDVKQDVRFIYAIKDELFTGKNRTKFFDSIIPIIPVSHSSNSYPQLKALLHLSNLLGGLDDEFLRDVSVYLDDMRMIKNIVTEYGIYRSTYEKKIKNLEWHKLFSFIVYKNIYCDDFAKLNNHEGMLANLIDSIHSIRNSQITKLEDKINEIQEDLIEEDHEILSNIEELNAVYITLVLKDGGYNIHNGFPYINGIPFNQLSKRDKFDELYQSSNPISFVNPHTGQGNSTRKPLSAWSENLSPSYETRRKILQRKQERNRAERYENIRAIEYKLQSVRNMSIKQLISEVGKDKVFSKLTDKAYIHLIEKGYLDEHYHLYIAHFHEGQLSKSDMDFVMAVKNRSPIDSHKTLSNCAEIIKYFSKEDYSSPAITNPHLISHLLENNLKSPFMEIITNAVIPNDNPFYLFESLINNVKNAAIFIELAVSSWPKIWQQLIESTQITNEKKSQLLIKLLVSIEGEFPDEVREFINSQNISLLIPQDETASLKIYEKIHSIGIKFTSLPRDCEASFMENILKRQMFVESFENLLSIFGALCGKIFDDHLYLKDITECTSESAKAYIADHINLFADLIGQRRVLLTSEQEYLNILTDIEVMDSHKISIIKNCNFTLSGLGNWDISEELVALIFLNQRILPSWENLFSLMDWVNLKDILYHYLNSETVIDALSSQDISNLNYETIKEVSEIFLLKEIDLYTFKRFLPKFLDTYELSQFVQLSTNHLKSYLTLANIHGNDLSFSAIQLCDRQIARVFLEDHFTDFRNQKFLSKIDLDDSDIVALLKSENLSIEDKKYLICEKRDEISFTTDIIELVIPTLIETQSETTPSLTAPIMTTILPLISKEEERVLCLGNQVKNLDPSSIWSLVELLGEEYKRLSQARGSFLMEKTDFNHSLVAELKNKALISSYTVVKRDNKEMLKINRKRS